MIKLKDENFHQHIKARMNERGITREEIEKTLNEGWEADDVKSGIKGNVFVFSYNDMWEGRFFEEKEVTVYYKFQNGNFILLTAKARYGSKFGRKNEDRI